jgi:hypothetical protein
MSLQRDIVADVLDVAYARSQSTSVFSLGGCAFAFANSTIRVDCGAGGQGKNAFTGVLVDFPVCPT